MPARRIDVGAVTGDAISDEEIRRVEVPSRLDFAASSVTNGDTVGVLLNSTEILPTDECNIEASADVIDIERDRLIKDLFIGRGQLRVPVGAVTTELQFWIQHQPAAVA